VDPLRDPVQHLRGAKINGVSQCRTNLLTKIAAPTAPWAFSRAVFLRIATTTQPPAFRPGA